MQSEAKPLLRDEDGRVIAVACSKCGRLALNVETGLCCGCHALAELTAQGFIKWVVGLFGATLSPIVPVLAWFLCLTALGLFILGLEAHLDAAGNSPTTPIITQYIKTRNHFDPLSCLYSPITPTASSSPAITNATSETLSPRSVADLESELSERKYPISPYTLLGGFGIALQGILAAILLLRRRSGPARPASESSDKTTGGDAGPNAFVLRVVPLRIPEGFSFSEGYNDASQGNEGKVRPMTERCTIPTDRKSGLAAALVACHARLASGSLGARRLFDAVNEAFVCDTWPHYSDGTR